MKKTFLFLLAAVAIIATACSPGATLSGTERSETTIVEGMTVADPGEAVEGSLEPDTLFEASIGPDAVTPPDPVFSDDARSITNFDEPQVDPPVLIEEATPGPSQSFGYTGDTISVQYYDMEQQQAAATEYPVTDKSDPEEVVRAVTEALGQVNGTKNIKLNSAQYSGGNLFVDFDPSIYGIATNSADEHAVLESIADTYLTNVDGIRAVYFTVNGEPYTSEHTQLNANEAYKVLVDETQ